MKRSPLVLIGAAAVFAAAAGACYCWVGSDTPSVRPLVPMVVAPTTSPVAETTALSVAPSAELAPAVMESEAPIRRAPSQIRPATVPVNVQTRPRLLQSAYLPPPVPTQVRTDQSPDQGALQNSPGAPRSVALSSVGGGEYIYQLAPGIAPPVALGSTPSAVSLNPVQEELKNQIADNFAEDVDKAMTTSDPQNQRTPGDLWREAQGRANNRYRLLFGDEAFARQDSQMRREAAGLEQ